MPRTPHSISRALAAGLARRQGEVGRYASMTAAAAVALGGLAVLVGWAWNIEVLKRVKPGLAVMDPLTAIALVLCALTLWFTVWRSPRSWRVSKPVVVLSAGMVGILCILRIVGYVSGWEVGSDKVLFASKLVAAADEPPSRMPPDVAANLLIVAGAILLVRFRGRALVLARALALGGAMIAVLTLIGSLSGLGISLGIGGLDAPGGAGEAGVRPFIPMSAHGAAALLLLCLGTLVARPAEEWTWEARPGRARALLEWKLATGFATALVIAALIGTASYHGVVEFLDEAGAAGRWRSALEAATEVRAALDDAESGTNAYIATGAEADLTLYAGAGDRIKKAVDELRSHPAVGQSRREKLDRLSALAEERLGFLEGVVDVRRRDGARVAQQIADVDEGKRTAAVAATVLRELEDEAQRAVAVRERRARLSAGIAVGVVSTSTVMGIVLVGAAGVLTRRDVLGRAGVEGSLRETEEQLRFLGDSLLQVVWTAGENGRIEWYNTRWEEFTGLKPEESREVGWPRVVHTEDLPGCAARWKKALETGESFEGEFRFKRGVDGAYRRCLCRAVARRDNEGRIVQWVGTIADVQDQRIAEEELERARAFLDAVVENIPHMVSIKDARDLKTVLFNRTAERMTGMARSSVLGKSDDELFPAERAEPLLADDWKVLEDRLTRDIPEEPVETAEGHRILHTTKIPLLADDGTPRFLLGISEDITERKQAERDLQDAKVRAEGAARSRGELLTHISQEVRSSLDGLIGSAGQLLGKGLSEEQRRQALLMKWSAETLTALVNDAADSAEVEAGHLKPEPVEIDVHGAVEDVVERMAPGAAAKGLELACRIGGEVPARARCDGKRLRQVLANLVASAIRSTEKGSVEVRVQVESRTRPGDVGRALVKFSVTDTGLGMSPEKAQRLARPGSPAALAGGTRGGAGLGLAIARRLAEGLGGSMGAENEPGRGSAIWFTAAVEPADGADAPTPVPDGVRGTRVLVVDDSAVQREALVAQLAAAGCEVTGAANGEQAIGALTLAVEKGVPFAAALIDFQMPGMDGPEVASVVQSTPEIAATPLVLLVPVGAHVDDNALREAGIAAWIAKPARRSRLLEVVAGAAAGQMESQALGVREPEAPVAGPEGALKILLADDSEVSRSVVAEILTGEGYTVELVDNGRKAVEAVTNGGVQRGGGFGLVLMDCQMPEVDGFEATRELRRLEKEATSALGAGPHVPIIGLTAGGVKGDRERCLEAGMDAHVDKPIERTKLLKAIESALDATGARRKAA